MSETATQDNNKTGDSGDPKGAELGTVEERAARMGWTPKEKFRGDPERWVDAATFVKHGEESLPILRERLRTLERTNIDLGKSVAEFKKMSDTAFERAYAKAKRELEARIEAAAEKGGKEGAAEVKAATRELTELEEEKAERKAAGDKDPVFENWRAQNDWYADQELAIEAEGEALKLRKRGEKSEGLEFLDKVKTAVMKRFPEKFGNPRRQTGSGVERSGAGGEETASRGKKGWDQLPSDAKDAGERYIKQKLYKDKAAYAEAFFAQN